jgi:hypothetical protein
MSRAHGFTIARLTVIAGVLTLLLLAAAGAAAQSAGTPTHPAVDQVAQAASGSLQAAAHEFIAILNTLAQMPRPLPLQLALVVCGLALTLAGWRLSHTTLLMIGFAAGAALLMLYVMRGGTAATFTALFLGGMVGALLSFVVFYVALFALGFYAGAALTLLAAALLGLAPVTLFGLLLGGLAGGALMLALRGLLLLAVAAGAGGLMLSLGLGLGLHWAVLFALAGLLVQSALSAVYPAPARPAAYADERGLW